MTMLSQAEAENLFQEARLSWQHLTRAQFDRAYDFTYTWVKPEVSLADFKQLLWTEIEEIICGETFLSRLFTTNQTWAYFAEKTLSERPWLS